MQCEFSAMWGVMRLQRWPMRPDVQLRWAQTVCNVADNPQASNCNAPDECCNGITTCSCGASDHSCDQGTYPADQACDFDSCTPKTRCCTTCPPPATTSRPHLRPPRHRPHLRFPHHHRPPSIPTAAITTAFLPTGVPTGVSRGALGATTATVAAAALTAGVAASVGQGGTAGAGAHAANAASSGVRARDRFARPGAACGDRESDQPPTAEPYLGFTSSFSWANPQVS